VEKQFKHNGSSPPPQAEPDTAAMLKRIQQQLVFLEKKIDTLISRPSERPSKGQHFSKLFRPYGRPYQHGKRKHYNSSRENSSRGNSSRESNSRGNSSREGGFDRGRRFDRGPGGGNRRFDQGKRPFFQRRKKHA